MTNAEKYLKPDMRVAMWKDYNQTGQKCKSIWQWLDQETKPTLTEDERVILRNISKEYVKVGKNNEGLYFLSYRGCEPNECCSYYANVFKSSLFSFIQEGDEYSIEELLDNE